MSKNDEPIWLDTNKERFINAMNKWIIPEVLKLDPAELKRRKEQAKKEETA